MTELNKSNISMNDDSSFEQLDNIYLNDYGDMEDFQITTNLTSNNKRFGLLNPLHHNNCFLNVVFMSMW
jgi:hypothetical protein